tara:strand:- start:3610 stop:4779 length:1170 start_codon:yes stop_codon:yes gene_type:complete
MKKSVVYWSPCLTRVGTVKSTLNSAISLAKYSKNYEVTIINVFGEWSSYKNYLNQNNVNLKNLTFNYYKLLPKNGFLKSRISYIIIFLISALPLLFYINKRKPDYLIIHLITSLPLFLLNFFKLQTQVILRISGFPKMNILRKKLWVKSQNKIFKITSPTEQLKNDLISKNIFKKEKVETLFDAIINVKDLIKKKNKSDVTNYEKITKNFFLSAGRFTRQKNFIYLIREFGKFLKFYPDEKLLIIGEGELKKKMQEEILKLDLSNSVRIQNYTENIYYFMKNSKCFILSSLWEEVGFVMVEASFCNNFIISSNCKNGPEEFLENGSAGLIFSNNKKNMLCEKLIEFKKLDNNTIFKKKILAKKNCSNFTMFNHYKKIKYILSSNQKIIN